MNRLKLLAVLMLVTVTILLTGCIAPTQPANTVNILYSKGTGPMPTLLGTRQVDGYIAWQPFVEVAPLAGIGKVLVYSQNLPPAGRWDNHPCCVLTARTDVMDRNPALVDALSALTILSTQYINEHPNETAEIVADWLAGKGNFTYGNISVSSVEVLKRAVPTVRFTNEPTDKWENGNIEFLYALRELGTITGSLKNTTDNESKALLFDTGPYQRAEAMINSGNITTPPSEKNQLSIGYLLSDHHAALFVAIKDWEYFNQTYGIALKPRTTAGGRPDLADLIVNGKTVATFRLISADAGPQLMQLAATGEVQFAYVGNPPAINAIDKGTPIKILMAVNTEGSGLVVLPDSPATDWDGFVNWAKQRASSGKPVIIATPGKGSIQDVMIKYAIEESGLTVSESS